MKQILQHLRSGEIEIADLPDPQLRSGAVLIQTTRSLISAGTERMLVEFGKASLLAKARAQPDKVKQVLDKIRTDGLMPTLEAVFSRLDEPLPLGYCNAGRVLAVGAGVSEFAPGDRVISNGAHAELVCVPKHLCAKIPDGVDDAHAAFTVLASIALQGQRLLEPTFGERVVVVGLGLIGLVAVQLLLANGCEVLGIDINAQRLAQAERYGAKVVPVGGDPVAAAQSWSQGRGVDGVLVTASAKTDEIMHQAAQMSRKRGRIVLVGVVGLNLRRADFYEKELTFQVSCSYGPGRYDSDYEQAGQDYPYGFVRWTEQRNFDAILGAIAANRVHVDELITHRFAQADAAQAYGVVSDDKSALGVVLEYPEQVAPTKRVEIATRPAPASGQPVVGVIGAGNFAKLVMLPGLAKTDARIAYVSARNPAPAQHAAKKVGAESVIADHKLMLEDEAVNGVLIAAQHNVHARLVTEALQAGKHVFVEKPLALTVDELNDVLAAAASASDKTVMVGFNRRFSPHTVRLKQLLSSRSEPLCLTFTANAGAIPVDHWTQDPQRGGGRIIGEACHFVDLLLHLVGTPIASVSAAMVGEGATPRDDKMTLTLTFTDGSVGVVNYFANGSKSYPKERLEAFSEGRVLVLDNFRSLIGYGVKGFKRLKTSRQDKGHNAEFAAFVDHIRSGGAAPIPLNESVNVTLATFAAVTSAREGRTIALDREYGNLFQAGG